MFRYLSVRCGDLVRRPWTLLHWNTHFNAASSDSWSLPYSYSGETILIWGDLKCHLIHQAFVVCLYWNCFIRIQWFSTGVPRNPWVPWKALWVPPIYEIDVYLVVNSSLGCRQIVLQQRKGAANQKRLRITGIDRRYCYRINLGFALSRNLRLHPDQRKYS